MNKHTSLVLGVVAGVLVVGAGCAQVSQKSTVEGDAMMKKDGAMMEKHDSAMMNDSMKKDGAMMKNDDAMMMKDDKAMMEVKGSVKVEGGMMAPKDGTMMKSDSMMKDEGMMKAAQKGSYEAYSPEKLAYAKAGGHVVLFFHAPWCPTCRAANERLTANAIPDGLLVLKTDYDSSTELKKKYGVTSQHTFVEVDAEGNMIKKWLGSTTATEIAAQVKE